MTCPTIFGILACLLGILCINPYFANANKNSREGKLFSLVNIVNFENGPCSGSGNKNGTCYTQAECSEKGGSKQGSCASGYGVCCIFSAACGQTTHENCTYFESSTVNAGSCRVKVCKLDSNICQLRLDFNTFMISGPSTSTVAISKAIGGGIVKGSDAIQPNVAEASKCLADKFSVTNPGGTSPPTICGTNNEEHMYVDASDSCNDLVFQLGSTASAYNRQWSIKITQYDCSYDNLAPKGCTQYFFDTDSGAVQTYNYGGDIHLADQRQQICIRQEAKNCRICYTAATPADFSVSFNADSGVVNRASMCCGYGRNGRVEKGFDCLIIPGAEKNVSPFTLLPDNHFCGRKLATAIATMSQTICTSQRPFVITFISDSFEFSSETKVEEDIKLTKGFKLLYKQLPC